MACSLPDHPAYFGRLGDVKSTEGDVKPTEKRARVAQHLIADALRDNPFFVTSLSSPEAAWGLNICVCFCL